MNSGADMNKVRQYLEQGIPVSEVSWITGYAREHVKKVRRDIRRERISKDGFMIGKKEVLIVAAIVAFLIAFPYLVR